MKEKQNDNLDQFVKKLLSENFKLIKINLDTFSLVKERFNHSYFHGDYTRLTEINGYYSKHDSFANIQSINFLFFSTCTQPPVNNFGVEFDRTT